jgi:hypothetical protein
MEIDILGIDLAKQVFQLHGAYRRGRAVHRAKVSRGSLAEFVRTPSFRLSLDTFDKAVASHTARWSKKKLRQVNFHLTQPLLSVPPVEIQNRRYCPESHSVEARTNMSRH